MSRHTSLQYCLEPTAAQQESLQRHAGASRFAFNQCLRIVKDERSQRRIGRPVDVPWSGFDLINAFNRWKKTEAAGRIFTVDSAGATEVVATGLAWRNQVCHHVFEEAAVDCARALAAWSNSRNGQIRGKPVGFPRFERKNSGHTSFRLRNRHRRDRQPAVRIGEGVARSVKLPGVGVIRVHDDTRPLRRLLANNRAEIRYATVSYRAGRWWVSLNVEAADLHPAEWHRARESDDHDGWVGVDRGLSTFLVAATADGCQVARIDSPPRASANGFPRQRRLAKTLSRKQKGSQNRKDAVARLRRHQRHVRNVRDHFLHRVSNELVKTHDRLVLEDLNTTGMLSNHRVARAFSDAGWAEFARLLNYKQAWRRGIVAIADRWFPSSKQCSICGAHSSELTLADRVFTCPNGHRLDRDLNAAINLATWGHTQVREPEARAPTINAHRREGTGRHRPHVGETSPKDVGTEVHAVPAV